MKVRPRCLRCIALGLVLSALIHGAAAAWWLHDRTPSVIPPETRLVEIDLSVFGPAPGESPAGPAPAEPDAVQDEMLAQAPEPEPEPITEPPPPPEEEPEPEEPTVSEVPPEPVAPPEPEPESNPIPEVQPPAPPPEKPKVVKRTPEKRPERKVKRPKKEIERPAKKPEKPQKPKRQTQTEVARADRSPKPAPSDVSSTKAQTRSSGSPSAGRTSRNAEAAYLAELQRAIARHQQFPSEARRKRQTGVTTLSFVVQRDGRIRQVRVTKSSGNASLDEAAMTAMQRLSRFKPIPAVIDRQEWPMRVPIRFDLR